MLFSYKDLIPNNNVEKRVSIDTSGSLLIESLNYISESDNTIREMIRSIVKESYSSENPVITFNEAFNFRTMLGSVIDFFIEAIKKVYNTFKTMLSKIFGGNKVLDDYKSDLKNYSKSLKVYYTHYNYTNLDADIPPSSLETLFQEEYDNLSEELHKIGDMNEKQIIIAELNKLSDVINGDKNYFNILRRKVMGSAYKGSKEAIPEVDYIKELKLLFRGNMDSPSNEDIPASEVRKSAEIFFDNKAIEDGVKDQKNRIEKSAGNIKQKLEKMSPANFMTEYKPIDYDIEFALNKVLKAKTEQLSTACNIIVIAYTEKLQAVKDAVAQYRKVLHDATQEIINKG